MMANVVGVMKNSNIEEQGGGSTEIEDLQIGPHWMKLMKVALKTLKFTTYNSKHLNFENFVQ